MASAAHRNNNKTNIQQLNYWGKRKRKKRASERRRDESNIDTQHFCRFREIYAMRMTRMERVAAAASATGWWEAM